MNKFDSRFTETLRQWLDNENRDYAEGAMLLYRLRANPIEFRKLTANPLHYKDYIIRNIKKFYDFRASKITHQQVAAKVEKAVKIAEDTAVRKTNEEKRSGKRADHDSLPDEIKKCYSDNIAIMQRIADDHATMRVIIRSKAPCKDADLMPLAQDIIKLDKQRLANWKKYDEYEPE